MDKLRKWCIRVHMVQQNQANPSILSSSKETVVSLVSEQGKPKKFIEQMKCSKLLEGSLKLQMLRRTGSNSKFAGRCRSSGGGGDQHRFDFDGNQPARNGWADLS